MAEPTPVISCPGPMKMGCGTPLYLSDPYCYGCGRTFAGGELWDLYKDTYRH